MKKTLLLFAGIALITALSCEHKPTEVQPNQPNTTGGGTTTEEPDTSLCFERDILPIFISNCAKSGCHDAQTRGDGYEFTSYATITSKKFTPGNPGETELYKKITDNDHNDRMPPPPNAALSNAQIGLIYEWIRRGAPNTTGCKSNCDSTSFLFAKDILPIFNQNCKGCHNSAAPSAGISLDNHNGVMAVVNDGRLVKAINYVAGVSPMPKGGAKLSACRIRQIEKWVAAGALNN